MADIAFIVQNKVKAGAQLDASVYPIKLYPDVTTEIIVSMSNDITAHPVERDSDITDNVRKMNNSFTVQGCVTDIPLTRFSDNHIGYQANARRRQEFYDYVKSLRDNAIMFDLVVELDIYEDCVIKSLNFPVTSDSVTAFKFSLEIQQMRWAILGSAELLAPKNVAEDTKKNAASTVNKGSTAPKKPEASYGQILQDWIDGIQPPEGN